MRDDGNEVAGMLNAMRLTAGGYTGELVVTVAADGGVVRLRTGSDFPAGLTADQARFLARKLNYMARLVDQRQGGPK